MNNDFFEDRKAKVETFKDIRGKTKTTTKVNIPDGLFIKCDNCHEYIFHEDLSINNYTCHICGHHFRINARDRINLTCDKDSFVEMDAKLISKNPLDFPDYEVKIEKYQKSSNELEAFICGTGKIKGITVAIGVLDSNFMMGSMGSVVGEKVTRLAEYATTNKLPLIIFSASGGARMQEGMFSLMQMAKTSAAIKHHHNAGLLYISILTDPTTGGVAASFAFLGDVIIAEKGALIGFAGKRVIQQTIKQDLPHGFQTAEFQQNKGFVDIVCNRNELRNILYKLLILHGVKS
ncbi:MAG TPA: acetyl-CoA carboxylase carboxyltransferase subunit beta [Acholeplasmataceae bacterium]|jgi:acetyl-CoA carboxylase carboxyl transferase subunit beta|nr:acetyl-CoA carboxylase carboxyltransferase subunit beta [Acholeplasmataceae bacterium]